MSGLSDQFAHHIAKAMLFLKKRDTRQQFWLTVNKEIDLERHIAKVCLTATNLNYKQEHIEPARVGFTHQTSIFDAIFSYWQIKLGYMAWGALHKISVSKRALPRWQ